MFARGRALLKQNETLLIIYIQTALATLGFGLISPVLPLYARSFGVSIFMIGLLVTSVGVVRVLLDVPMGRISDRFGRKPLVVLGSALMALGSFGGAMSGNFWMFMAFRVMWGVGSSFCTMSLQTMLTDVSTTGNRGRVMSAYQAAFQVGHSMGPAIGGLIAYYYGLRGPFFAYSTVALFAMIWASLRLRETRKPAAATATGHREAAGTAAHEPRKSSFALYRQLLLDTSFMLVALLTFTHAMSRTGTNQIVLPILASEQVGINTGQLGLALTLTGLVHLFTTFVGGWISDRFGRKRALVPGYLIMAMSIVVFALSRNYWVFLIGSFAMGLGRGISGPTVAYAADLAQPGQFGATLGLFHTFNDLGMVIGPLIIGWLADNRGLAAPFYFEAIVLTLAAILFGLFARETVRRGRKVG
ncbi:MAG: MFS transporter [Dehalococcoidia bacterium]|nr:MFS transporter [Dehalococcoidia bacterium]